MLHLLLNLMSSTNCQKHWLNGRTNKKRYSWFRCYTRCLLLMPRSHLYICFSKSVSFVYQLLGDCHCCWTRESLKARVVKRTVDFGWFVAFGEYKFQKRLILRYMHHFNSDLINNMDHIRISGTYPSSVILSQTT